MRDPRVENWLKANGYNYKYVEKFPIDQIDLAEARDNPVRLDAKFDEDLAETYGILMLDIDFPAVVLLEIAGRALKKVLGGTHRLIGAGKVKVIVFDAYIVREADPLRVDALHGVLNSLEGWGETVDGRLLRAADLKRKHPSVKSAELAKMFGLSRTAINEFLQADRVEQKADKLGLGTFFSSNKMTTKCKAAFDGLQSDAIFIATANLIQAHPDIRGGGGVSLLKELKTAGSDTKAKAIILDRDRELTKQEARRTTKRVRTKSHKATRFLSKVHGVNKAWPGTVERLYLAGLETASAIRAELKSVDQSIDIHMEVREELKRLLDEVEKAAEWDKKTPRPGAGDSEPTSPPP